MKIQKFQEGGAVAPAAAAPQQDPLLEIAQIFAEGLQAQDCQMLAQGAQMFLELLSQAQAPAQAPAGEPVFKKGGKLAKRRACKK